MVGHLVGFRRKTEVCGCESTRDTGARGRKEMPLNFS